MRFGKHVALAAIAGSLGMIGAAQHATAGTIDWTLQNVTFTDGGTATGSFSTDSTTGLLTALDITTSVDSTLGLGTTFDLASVSFNASNTFVMSIPGDQFSLDFANALSTPGADPLLSGPINQEDSHSAVRFVGGGDAVGVLETPSVPEPATFALLGAGVAGLAVLRRRKAR
jgi:hypothetical protein